MDRKLKMLSMAMQKDNDTMDRLRIPKYESTKGLNADEINILLSSEWF